MEIIQCSKKNNEAFKAYCQKHRYEHDESYLYEEDMEEFDPEGLHPTWLLVDHASIIGAISFMLDPYFVANRKSRLRIFHCESNKSEHYQWLLEATSLNHPDLDVIEMFLPNKATASQAIVKNLGFNYYRTSYVMIRKGQVQVKAEFPVGYELRPFRIGDDEVHYAHIRNTAFKTLKGSEAPMSIETIQKLTTDTFILDNGLQLLWHKDRPVGILRMIDESDQSGKYSFVAPIALLPEYHGKGLGTQLLKAGIAIGQANGYDNCMLSVNAENEQALGLYTKVGFMVDEAVSCLQKPL